MHGFKYKQNRPPCQIHHDTASSYLCQTSWNLIPMQVGGEGRLSMHNQLCQLLRPYCLKTKERVIQHAIWLVDDRRKTKSSSLSRKAGTVV